MMSLLRVLLAYKNTDVYSRQNYLHESHELYATARQSAEAQAVALPSENVFNGSLFMGILLVF